TTEKAQVIEYDITIAAIEEMKQKYSGMKITDAASDKAVRAARTFVVSKRTAVEKRRVELNEEANKHRRKVNEKAKEITVLLLPIEEPLQAEVKRVDDEIAAKKAEKDRLEEERKENIRAEIHKIQEMAMPSVLGTMALENLRELSNTLEDYGIDVSFYAEFIGEVEKVLNDSYEAVRDAITARIKLDKEAEERKAEDARLEKVRKKQEADQKILDEANKKIKAAQKKIDDQNAKIAADKKADDEKKAFDQKMKDLKAQADADAAQKVKDDAAAKEKKEKADKTERLRVEALRPDREKLISFVGELMSITGPLDLKDKSAIEILDDMIPKIRDIALEIKKKAQEL
ncbi:unnamed protein product, partial [marine sediment metagenome]